MPKRIMSKPRNKKTIEDLKIELEMDRDRYQWAVENSDSQVSRHVCYGKLHIIHTVLDFIKDNKLIK